MTIRPEAQAAADWWAEALASGTDDHDLGDRDASERDLTATARAGSAWLRQRFTAEQVEAFRREVAEGIEQHLAKSSWDPAAPLVASALRALQCDYGPDAVLAEAAERVGVKLKMFDLPMKTVMWINPGEVKVSAGYGADVVVVWSDPSAASSAE